MHLMAQVSPSQWFLMALFAASGLMLYHAQRRWQRVATARPSGRYAPLGESPRRRPSASADHAAKQAEVQTHGLTHEATVRIDSKLAALEHLMRAAQQETQRLEAAIAKARAAGLPGTQREHDPDEAGAACGSEQGPAEQD